MIRLFLFLLFLGCAFQIKAQSDTLAIIKSDSSFIKDNNRIPFHDSIYQIIPDNPLEVCPKIEDISERPLTVSTGDSLWLSTGDVVVFQDTAHCIFKDTIVFVPYGLEYRIAKNSEVKALELYELLKLKTDKHWWSSLAYSSLLTYDPGDVQSVPEEQQEFKESQKIYNPYQGAVIRSINIRQVDVLEGSVDDTTKTAKTLLAKLANALHTNTREYIIRNNLLFEIGDLIFDYLVADNERLIRQLSYIQDCRILVVNSVEDSKEVDVWIITEDKFSIAVDGVVSEVGNYYGEISETNLAGIGHELGFGMRYVEVNDPSLEYSPWYKARNLSGSFVDFAAKYSYSYKGTELVAGIGRGFVNQFTKYAFNVDLGFVTTNNKELQADSSYIAAKYTYNYQDVWLGRQFVIGDKSRRKNLIIAGRTRRYDAVNRPFVSADSNAIFHNNRLYLGAITFKKSLYYKNNYIYRFGVTEDIPYGYTLQYNLGYEDEEYKGRMYTSATIGLGFRLNRIGYISTVNEFGTYIRRENLEQGQYKFRGQLIANIIKVGRYKVRNILTYSYVVGFNRATGEKVSIENRVRGLKGEGLNGSEISLLHYEVVNFTPWNIYGFRFAIATYADAAILHSSPIKGSNLRPHYLYTSIGMALRIRNESLAIRSIEISFAYFPNTTNLTGNWDSQFSTSSPATQQLYLSEVPSIVSYDLR